MARAERPSTPEQELAALRATVGAVLPGSVLTPDLAAFCESGVSIIVGARAADGWPRAGMALAARVEAGGGVRLVLREPANRALLAAVGRGAGLAATFSRPRDHRSIQLKAAGGRVGPSGPEDAAEAARQAGILCEALQSVGYRAAFARLYCAFRPDELAAIAFRPEAAFVQTPGPGAGSALAMVVAAP